MYNLNIVHVFIEYFLHYFLIQNMTINSAFSLTQQFNDTVSISLLVLISLSFWMLDMVYYIDRACGWCSNAIFVRRTVFDIFTGKDDDLSIPQIFILRNHQISLLCCSSASKDRVTFLIKQLPAEWLLNLNSTQYSRKYC